MAAQPAANNRHRGVGDAATELSDAKKENRPSRSVTASFFASLVTDFMHAQKKKRLRPAAAALSVFNLRD